MQLIFGNHGACDGELLELEAQIAHLPHGGVRALPGGVGALRSPRHSRRHESLRQLLAVELEDFEVLLDPLAGGIPARLELRVQPSHGAHGGHLRDFPGSGTVG